MITDDVKQLVKRWVTQARADAKARGEYPPPPYSRLPDHQRSLLFREAHWWQALASGQLLASCVPPHPSPDNITAMREHLTRCFEHLHTKMGGHADLLPTGTHDQLSAIQQRTAAALDVVEQAGAAWSREADAAWQELMRWAGRLNPAGRTRQAGDWVPDGWQHYGTTGS
ncbi:hypothetical protein [Streptomyces sp. NRRL S-920]|uniref:hypothetical protein n=1 Tax=Streptomyces sp. NRRL S-920 TaxID=1463921 RepID=UPI00131D33AB|nr:hypothetical protein [Streptomyces sp. NRRL S-920]